MPGEMDEPAISVWRPLEHSVFRALWIASLVSSIGTWMQNVGGVWLMSSFSASPFLVALMQTATSLPVFLVGLPAGALGALLASIATPGPSRSVLELVREIRVPGGEVIYDREMRLLRLKNRERA